MEFKGIGYFGLTGSESSGPVLKTLDDCLFICYVIRTDSTGGVMSESLYRVLIRAGSGTRAMGGTPPPCLLSLRRTSLYSPMMVVVVVSYIIMYVRSGGPAPFEFVYSVHETLRQTWFCGWGRYHR